MDFCISGTVPAISAFVWPIAIVRSDRTRCRADAVTHCGAPADLGGRPVAQALGTGCIPIAWQEKRRSSKCTPWLCIRRSQ